MRLNTLGWLPVLLASIATASGADNDKAKLNVRPAAEYPHHQASEKVTIAKINIDENPHVPTKYGVRGIPTMMIFSQGQVAATKVGALPKSKIKEWIESSI